MSARKSGKTLLGEAAELVVSRQLGSTSMLQRNLHLTFPHASRLMNELEAHGVVGPQKPGQSREVLARADQVAEILAQIGVGP